MTDSGCMSNEEKIARLMTLKLYIREWFKPSRVIHHMAALLSEECTQEILNIEEQKSPQKAVDRMLFDIFESSNDNPGWLEIFTQALRSADLSYLCDIIECHQDVPNFLVYKNIIKLCQSRLAGILPNQLIPHMTSSGCLSQQDQEEIEAATRSGGAHRGAALLILSVLRGNVKDNFIHLVRALRATGSKHLVEWIEPQFFQARSDASIERKVTLFEWTQHANVPIRQETKGPVEHDEGDLQSLSSQFISIDPVHEVPTSQIVLSPSEIMEGSDTRVSQILEETVPKLLANQPIPHEAEDTTGDSFSTTSQETTTKAQALYLMDDEDTERKTPMEDLNVPEIPAASVSLDRGLVPQNDTGVDVLYHREEVNEQPYNNGNTDTANSPKPLNLREYQKELAEPTLNGDNAIIIAPTDSGKTHVAMYISKIHFEKRAPSEKKVIFFVPTNPLVEQQSKAYRDYNEGKREIIGISGSSNHDTPHIDLMLEKNILIMTPQVMLDVLKRDATIFDKITLMIFDECHHAGKGHPYANLLHHYMKKQNLAEGAILPQIIGLTASVGVGKAGSKDKAVEHVLGMCAMLDIKEQTGVSVVRRNTEELERFTKQPDEERREAPRRNNDSFFTKVSSVMNTIEIAMKTKAPDFEKLEKMDVRLFNPPKGRGEHEYTNWIGNMAEPLSKVADIWIKRYLHSCVKQLEIYQKALQLNEDCETADAVMYLKKEIYEPNWGADETDKWLIGLFSDNLDEYEKISQDPINKNPKLELLRQVIEEKEALTRDNGDLRAIVFVKTRELVTAIDSWMDTLPKLRELGHAKLVGARVSFEQQGMTSKKQDEVLLQFRDGECKILIATSVAEEGLDIRKCNVVVRYNCVTNEIARVQTRGRGRAEDAIYVVIGNHKVNLKETVNEVRESLMNEALRAIDHMPENTFKQNVKTLKRKFMMDRKLDDLKDKNRYQYLDCFGPEDHQVICKKCSEFACFLGDMRKVKDTQHVIITPEFNDRVIYKKYCSAIKISDTEVSKTHKMLCKKCSDTWGSALRSQGTYFPVLTIKLFTIVHVPSGERKRYKQWKDMPFIIPDITDDEMDDYTNRYFIPETEELGF